MSAGRHHLLISKVFLKRVIGFTDKEKDDVSMQAERQQKGAFWITWKSGCFRDES